MTDNIYTYILGGILLGVGSYYILSKKTRIETLEEKGIKMAEDIVVDHFTDLIKNNPSISLDHAILDFEKAKTKDLEEFAKSKSRTKKMYHESYSEYFEQAKIQSNNIY